MKHPSLFQQDKHTEETQTFPDMFHGEEEEGASKNMALHLAKMLVTLLEADEISKKYKED